MQGYLVRKRRLEAPEAKFVAYQIAKGLKVSWFRGYSIPKGPM